MVRKDNVVLEVSAHGALPMGSTGHFETAAEMKPDGIITTTDMIRLVVREEVRTCPLLHS